jgi:hypothetical protein
MSNSSLRATGEAVQVLEHLQSLSQWHLEETLKITGRIGPHPASKKTFRFKYGHRASDCRHLTPQSRIIERVEE